MFGNTRKGWSPGCCTLEAAKKLSRGFDDVSPMSLDVEDPVALDAEVAKVDLVVGEERSSVALTFV